ncbi:MAG: glycosyltransferase, partial [Planctomycetes bacterium]|nr:glycosyltransferase [Planctomycetota bacterium]
PAPRIAVLDGASPVLRAAAKCLGLAAPSPLAPAAGPSERARLLGSALAFVLPGAATEGLLAAAEAMRLGVPVVAPACPGAREILGAAALYFPAESARGIALALGEVLEDAALRRGLAQRGMARARAFPWEAAACRLLDVFAEALGRGESQPVAAGARGVHLGPFDPWPAPQAAPPGPSSPTARTSTGERPWPTSTGS